MQVGSLVTKDPNDKQLGLVEQIDPNRRAWPNGVKSRPVIGRTNLLKNRI